jgi:hypothetical protein
MMKRKRLTSSGLARQVTGYVATVKILGKNFKKEAETNGRNRFSERY